MKKEKTKKKTEFVDDGRTIANMNVEGLPWYISKDAYQTKSQLQELHLTKEERRAMIWAAMSMMIPILVVVTLSFFGVFLFLDIFWLR
ncbi:MAG: hypothetical protein ACRCW2_14880 [Cellulosilyticaceae bacterium]